MGGKGLKKESQTVNFKQRALNICSSFTKYGSRKFLKFIKIHINNNLIIKFRNNYNTGVANTYKKSDKFNSSSILLILNIKRSIAIPNLL